MNLGYCTRRFFSIAAPLHDLHFLQVNPIGPDAYFKCLRPEGGGSFLPNPFYNKTQRVSQLSKEEVFITEVASSPVKLAARVLFSDDARILKDFFLITQSLWQNFWKIKISKKN